MLEISKTLPGVFHMSENRLVWCRGRHSVTFLRESALPSLQAIWDATERLTGAKNATSSSQACRDLLKWVGIERDSSDRGRAQLRECGWHFFRCRPGLYEGLELYDINGAYYNLLRRLPSPAVILTSGSPLFPLVDPDKESRWRQLVDSIGHLKGLRNSLVGCMVGGGENGWSFHRGALVARRARRGPMHDTGALIVRTVHDLCAMEAAESEAFYANTDCVAVELGKKPVIWPDMGVESKLEAFGRADLVAIGCYAIGAKATKPYQQGHRFYEHVESQMFHRDGQWRWLERN